MKIVFASNNPGKLHEVKSILGSTYDLSSLNDIGCHEDIPEPFHTLEENALAKARHVFQHYGMNCFADDTGLEVDALDGLPGVQSARFAGESKKSEANVSKLLTMMQGIENRRAQFRTAMALIINGKEYLFEGIVRGTIASTPEGTGGFGYDPVFIPDGFSKTFAEMTDEQKNRLSHRYEALREMVDFIKQNPSPLQSLR